MKILFLSNSIGGLISFRYEFIEKLRSLGNDVYISSPLEVSPECFVKMGCEIIPTSFAQRGMNPLSEFKIIGLYNNIISSIHPDIVLSYTIKPNIYGSIACRKLGIPIIASVTGLGVAMEKEGILQKITVALFKYGFKKTDFVFFQNQESIDFFIKKKIPLKDYTLSPGSGVNLKKFIYQDYPAEEGPIKFLFISRILEAKGIKQYLDAATYCKKYNMNTEFHIVGIRDDKRYDELIDKMHKENTIVFHGQQADVRPFIKECHCLIHPSYYPEGLSNVLLESAATGRPAITTDKAGCKEVVLDKSTGFLVRQKDSEDLIEKIKCFLDLSYEEKKNLGLTARKRVEDYFSRDYVIQLYMDKINQLVK